MSDSSPWFIEDAGPEARKFAPATLRNRNPITEVLRNFLPSSGLVLELASGSGEHVVHFAAKLPWLRWQPSDRNEEACRSVAAWTAEAALENVLPPVRLDVSDATWPFDTADAILCINMAHISAWEATVSVFSHAATLLEPGNILYFYGPFIRDGVVTSPSNVEFDYSLKSRNPDWGLREVAAIDRLAVANGFLPSEIIEMPANNLSLLFRRR